MPKVHSKSSGRRRRAMSRLSLLLLIFLLCCLPILQRPLRHQRRPRSRGQSIAAASNAAWPSQIERELGGRVKGYKEVAEHIALGCLTRWECTNAKRFTEMLYFLLLSNGHGLCTAIPHFYILASFTQHVSRIPPKMSCPLTHVVESRLPVLSPLSHCQFWQYVQVQKFISKTCLRLMPF